jgi:integrase|tara:strand:- start:743 stop:2158 length:1416 start_codon:yes stop_codon:yes gene_type:complete
VTTVNLGVFNVSIQYLWKPNGRHTWHYRRAVPAAIKHHYTQPHILKSLRTKDEIEAAKLCLNLNRQYEGEFERLKRGLPKSIAQPTYDLALEKLNSFGLYPKALLDDTNHPHIADDFLNSLEDKLSDVLPQNEFEQIWYYGKPIPDNLLDTVESAALDLLHGKYRPRASDYVESYVHLKDRQNDKRFVLTAERAIACLLEFLPDKPPGEYTRAEVRTLIKLHTDKKAVKTATLHRHLTILRAMFNKVAKERELKEDMLHPFTDFEVPHLREDAVDRIDFTTDELNILRQGISARKRQIESLIHLMLDTGLRVKECCGLKVGDIVVDADVAYLKVLKNPFRRLKTASSKRFIPLIGVALEAVKLEIENKESGDWLFPIYIDEAKESTKNTAASAAANKRIRSILGQDAPTCHSFRHTFTSRLRNVECPKDIRDELGGWASSVSDRYGSPADIKIKQSYLLKSIDAPSGVDWG